MGLAGDFTTTDHETCFAMNEKGMLTKEEWEWVKEQMGQGRKYPAVPTEKLEAYHKEQELK